MAIPEDNGSNEEEVVYKLDPEVFKTRPSTHPIHPIILSRHSLRSMTRQPISDDLLITLFEAAHWAPAQNWRFIYAKRDTEFWSGFLGLIPDETQSWAQDASVLVIVISKRIDKEEVVRSKKFEAGSAWSAMALEGSARGLALHLIREFNREAVKSTIGLGEGQEEYDVEVMIAIGLPDIYNAEWEEITLRREIGHFVCEGIFEEKMAGVVSSEEMVNGHDAEGADGAQNSVETEQDPKNEDPPVESAIDSAVENVAEATNANENTEEPNPDGDAVKVAGDEPPADEEEIPNETKEDVETSEAKVPNENEDTNEVMKADENVDDGEEEGQETSNEAVIENGEKEEEEAATAPTEEEVKGEEDGEMVQGTAEATTSAEPTEDAPEAE